MAFTQDLFTSYRGYDDGNTRIGERNRIWYDSNTNTLRISDGSTPGGIIITGGGSGSYTLPIATSSSLGGVEIGTNIAIDSNGKISVDLSSYATTTYVTNLFENYNDLGNFVVNGSHLQTLSGTVMGADIVLNPNGGSVQVPSLKVGEIGNIVNTNLYIEAYITTYQLVSIVDYSTTAALITGTYGNINGVDVPWTVFELAPGVSGTPVSAVYINDILTGAGIIPSTIKDRGLGGPGGGDTTSWNNYVIVNLDLSQLGQILPLTGAIFNLTRPLTKPNFNIQSSSGTDIFLDSQGLGDVIVNTNILPLTNNISTLGSPTQRWKSIYVGPGTIYVEDETLGVDQAIGARDGLLYVQNGAGLRVGEWTIRDNYISIADSSRDVYIGKTSDTGYLKVNRPFQIANSADIATFQVTRNGRVQINTPNIPGNDPGSLLIVASTDGSYQPVNNAGGLLHLVGPDAGTGSAARINIESYGSNANFAPFINTRRARGTAANPSGVLANDVLFRLAATGWATTNYNDALLGFTFPGIDILASETFTHTAMGATTNIYAVPDGTTARVLSGSFTGTGLTFSGSAGITFSNNDRLTYFPTPVGQTDKWLNSNGTTMSWQTMPSFSGAVVYKSAWNANSNTPILTGTTADGVAAVAGWEYSISSTGTVNIGSGSQSYDAGGFVIYNGSGWDYIPPVSGVTSITFGSGSSKTGPVSVVSADLTSTLDSGSIANAKLSNSSVTVTAGSGLSGGGTVSLGNTITLTNAGVTSIISGTGIGVAGTGAVTITNNGILSVSNGGHITATTTSGVVTLGSDATINPTNNTLVLRDSAGGIDAKDFTALLDVAAATNHGAFNYGTLSYADTGLMADFSYNTNSYNQIILQNRNSGTGASSNYIVSNDQGTASTFYGEFGMNSSLFTSDGNSLSLPNAVYLNSISSDLVIGGSALHFVITGSAADAVTITDTEIDTYNNYVLKDGSDNVLLQLQNEGGIGKLKFNGGSQGIWYDGGVVINGVGYHTDYYGIQPMSYNSSTGQVTYGLIDYTHLTNKPTLFSGAYADLTGKPTLFSGSYLDLTNKPTIPSAQIQSDWTQTNNASLDYIKNKPSIPSEYTDARARAAISVSGSLSYNSSTGVISYNTPTYTVTTASASGGGALSLTGTTFTFTPASIPSYGVGGNQLVYVLNSSLSYASVKNTLISLFGLTNGVALTSNTRYQYEIVCNIAASKSGALSYALALNGGAVVAQHNSTFQANKTTTIDGYSAGITMASFNATGAAITTANAIGDTSTFGHYKICGTIDVTTGGSVNFMISQDQNTPITWSILAGSYIKLLPLGAIGANTIAGSWA